MSTRREILLVDDDRLAVRTLTQILGAAGYGVRAASDGAKAVEAVRLRRPDLVLLDVMMPRKGGLDVCRELRETDPALPIAFLTALETPDDEVRGLAAGGDAYIAKSAPDAVLLARLAALLRPREPASGICFPFGRWTVAGDGLAMREAGGRQVALTERELYLLRLFSRRPNEVLSRDALMANLWGGAEDGVTDNALSVTVYALRKKLGSEGERIVSLRGLGYVYRPS